MTTDKPCLPPHHHNPHRSYRASAERHRKIMNGPLLCRLGWHRYTITKHGGGRALRTCERCGVTKEGRTP